jgi:hypothetical protein
VGLVAILEIGITAALSAAAANWLILRRAAPHRGAEEAGGFRGVAPRDQHDETDDAGGHRIYLNPWAAHDEAEVGEDEEIPIGLIEEYRDDG